MQKPGEVLEKYWGFQSFKPAQETAIHHILNHQDVIALLPTGGGKSLCYQVPTMCSPGICIVISPLISLMQDQVENLKSKGIKAMSLQGKIPYKELLRKLDNCIYGGYKFLYLSPERLQQEIVQERIREMNINLIAVDEAHCISEWGHDFRPSYRDIKILKELQPNVPLIALTATATPRVLEDIQTNLEIEKAEIVQISFKRKNIALFTYKSEDKNYLIQKFLQKHPGVSIIYVRSRKLTLNLSDILNHNGFSAAAYHGGMSTTEKERLLKDWQSEKFDIMVATNAFGMGIDKANVKNVIHFQLPDSIESYYQEVGRAGRNGQPANALLVYDNGDILKLKDQFLKNAPTPETTKLVYKKLNAYFGIAYGEGQEIEYNFNFLDFCHTYNLNTYLTYNIFQFLDRAEIIQLSKEFHQRTALQFLISNQALYHFLEKNVQFKKLIHTLLRLKGGFFNYMTEIDDKNLQARTGFSQGQINEQLQKLEEREMIKLKLVDQDSSIFFLVPREDNFTINPIIPYIKQYYKSKKKKVNDLINFVEDNHVCKVKQLLNYFGEQAEGDCMLCSVCRKKYQSKANPKKEKIVIYEELMKLFSLQSEWDTKEIMIKLNYPEEKVLDILRIMIDKGIVERTFGNTYILNQKNS